jgi:hypothetical protein
VGPTIGWPNQGFGLTRHVLVRSHLKRVGSVTVHVSVS